MDTEVIETDEAIVSGREEVVIMECPNGLDVVRVGMVIGMHYFSTGHIEVSKHEVISSRVEVVPQILQRIHSLLVVTESPQLELLLSVHHLDASTLHPRCKHRSVSSQTQGRDWVNEVGDFLESVLGRVVDGDSAVMGEGEQVE